jgi:hypothetical protein
MTPEDSRATVLEDSPPIVRHHTHLPHLRRWRASDAAAVITNFVVLGTAATMYLYRGRGAGLAIFNFEHISFLNMVDTSSQRLAHRVALILLAALCSIGAAAITRPASHVRQVTELLRTTHGFFKRWSGVFVAVGAVLVVLFNLRGTVYPGWQSRGLLLNYLLLSACLTILGLLWAERGKMCGMAFAIWTFVAVHSIFLIVPGLARPAVAYEPELNWAEMHYSATLAPGDRLAAGLRVGSQIRLNYGLIHSIALAGFERASGFLDFGGHFRLVQFSQAVFLGVAILAFYLWRPGNPLFVLFGTLLIGPWVSTSHPAVYYPNQTGWRSFGFAVGVAVLIICRRQPLWRVALILGASAGFLMLYNPETGLCVSFGYGLFLLSRLKSLELTRVVGLAIRAALAACAVLLAVLIFFRAGVGTWPPFNAALLFGWNARVGEGFGGLPLYFDPLALLIFVHCVYVFSSAVLKWRVRDLEFDESVKLGISATILTWAAYYVNRPQAWNLWTFQFLYLFLVADIVEPRLFRRLRRHGIAPAIFDFRLASLTFLLIPMLLAMNHFILVATLSPDKKPEVIPSMVSGISIPEDVANDLRSQADFLGRQEASSTLFFSRHSYSLSLLARRFNPLPAQDVFAETFTHSDFDQLVGDINRMSPRVILFDAPGDKSIVAENLGMNYFNMQFFERLKIRLAGRYEEGPTTNGWQIWQLRLPEKISTR